jgi:hypothetical protein
MKYRLEVINDVAHVFYEDGTELNSQEYFEMRNPLTRAYMDKKKREARLAVDAICNSSAWVFPQVKRDIHKSGGCVYFLASVDMPELIKVGFSLNLAQRVSALKWSFSEPKVIAYVKTQEPHFLELGLHERFDAHRTKSEWFEAAPILSFVEQFRQV